MEYEDTTIMPTVGRVVYFKSRGSKDDVFPPRDFASLITRVYDVNTVSLVSFSETGMRFEIKVSRGNEAGQWNWMPYQLKTNQINSQSAEPRPSLGTTPVTGLN